MAEVCTGWLLLQSQQMAACNAVHSAEARFCRWLLRASDALDARTVTVTRETIANALGVRRTTLGRTRCASSSAGTRRSRPGEPPCGRRRSARPSPQACRGLQQGDRHSLHRSPSARVVGSLVLGLRCSCCGSGAPMPRIAGLHALPPAASAKSTPLGWGVMLQHARFKPPSI
jgi:hypothetical protein